ncbi:MAG: adenylyl-sulfate kinase [Rhodospirillaceae bacterium TMED8]|nr:adenylyl-sulfate kinase [Magnetovibrio sp.]OUT48093.1 MAG: adenylyl-sulfate kinase [Rhodospirillaceae bacterium TMED8]|tara:strand:- start:632 stop:1216 length:585 start_codon:yes stop_codon:yes gene_type:complete
MIKSLNNIPLEARWNRYGHRSGVLWFTGLSGSGKSSLAIGLERILFDQGKRVFVLDGDNLRHGLNGDLGFSMEDRRENIRRVTEVAAAYVEAGFIVISAFISPFRIDREIAHQIIGENFHEVFINATIDICEQRDPKGLYAKARAGEIVDFTGISSPYEVPDNPNLVVHTGTQEFSHSLKKLTKYAETAFILDR